MGAVHPWRFCRRCLTAEGGLLLAILGIACSGSGAANIPPRAPAGPGVGTAAEAANRVVRLTADQQRAIPLRTATIQAGPVASVLKAPGRVAPDETHYAYITPRAAGVVRSVTAQIGQEVKAGDLLAVIDSPDVAQARLDLVTRTQAMDVARAKADWQDALYRSTNELIERLKANDTPDEIHRRFEDRPIGETRERLITAYATFRLAEVTLERNQELQAKNAISLSQYQQARAEYESASAVYEGLMDRMGFEAALAHTQARQARRQAETAVRVAIESLRVLGLTREDPELQAAEQRLAVASRPPSTLADAVQGDATTAAGPTGVLEGTQPVSTYELRAPFAGTILERGVVVPGVAVDTVHQLFTIADLSTAWIEVHVHESDFPLLAGTRAGRVAIRARAYPDRVFEGTVLYTGDLVDEKSRMVKLLARAGNAERLLKPGMFVEVRIRSEAGATTPRVPESALLTDGGVTFVYVRTGPEQFERRDVEAGDPEGGFVVARRGLKPGDEVVIEGGFKLKSEAIRLAGS
jgi:multidrug efflux pump subunit AcrA (membrane-fusion protein)